MQKEGSETSKRVFIGLTGRCLVLKYSREDQHEGGTHIEIEPRGSPEGMRKALMAGAETLISQGLRDISLYFNDDHWCGEPPKEDKAFFMEYFNKRIDEYFPKPESDKCKVIYFPAQMDQNIQQANQRVNS